MSSFYDLVFSQPQPDNNADDEDPRHDNGDSFIGDNDEDPFRHEAKEALKRKKEEMRLVQTTGKKTGRVYARPTLYRTEEETASLKKSKRRSDGVARRAKQNKWNYFAEDDDDADPVDVIFRNMAAEQEIKRTKGNRKIKKPLAKSMKVEVTPLRLYGREEAGAKPNYYGNRGRAANGTYNSRPPNGRYWPLKVNAPIWGNTRNPIDFHLIQLSFLAARLLLNACGSNNTPDNDQDNSELEEHNQHHPTALTMDAIGHLYHFQRKSFHYLFATAFQFAMTLIADADESRVLKDNFDEEFEQPSAHEVIQHQINSTLALWRVKSNSVVTSNQVRDKRKVEEQGRLQPNCDNQKYVTGQQQHTQEQTKTRRTSLSRRQQRMRSTKLYADVSHATPISNFLPIFEMTSSLLLCCQGEILLTTDQNDHVSSRRGNEEDDDEDDGIYNASSLYQEEANDSENGSPPLLTEYVTTVKEYFSACRNNMKEKFNGDLHLNLMSFPQFMAVQRSQSFLCNSGMMIGNSLEDVAEELIKVGREVLHDQQIKKIFGDVHVTTGIAMVVASLCSNLSDSASNAAEIIASSSADRDNMACRTPFDIMCLAFRQLCILEDISRSILESSANEMHRASHIFEACWQNDTHNLNARLWHLASLLGSLILSSGKLSLLYHSSCAGNTQAHGRRTSTQMANIKLVVHESIRKEASEAFQKTRELLSQDTSENGHYSQHQHMIMSSLFEWTEAIYLLCRHGNSEDFQSITQLHAWHTICWSKEEKTSASLIRVRQLHKNKIVSTDSFLFILANCIEQDASNSKLWVELMCYLSNMERSSKNEESTWWGSGRSWWQTVFFSAPQKCYFDTTTSPSFEKNAGYDNADCLSFLSPETLENYTFLATIGGTGFPNSTNKPFNVNSTGIDFSSGPSLSIEWLRLPDEECDNLYIEEDADDFPSNSSHGSIFKDKLRRLLPQHCHEIIGSRPGDKSSADNDDVVLKRLVDECDSRSVCKQLYIKIVIASHLFDSNHCFIQQSVNWLFERHTIEQTRTETKKQGHKNFLDSDNALLVLSLLHIYHDIDVKSILMNSGDIKPPKKTQEKEAVRKNEYLET